MQTRRLKADEQGILEAAGQIQSGALVAFPTETVYGLGASVYDAAAVQAVFAAKGRPGDNPLIAHVLEIRDARELGEWTPLAQTLAEAFWPGPLTLIVKRRPQVSSVVSAGLPTIALRAPSHPVARALIAAAGVPIAAPSANRSGRPSPTTADHVMEDLGGIIPLVLDGGPSEVGLESTVVDATSEIPLVLRPGAVTPEMLATVAGECRVAEAVMRQLREGEYAPSPGMRHKHYAPKARMTLVEGSGDDVAAALTALTANAPNTWALALSDQIPQGSGPQWRSLGRDAGEAAHNLFYLLREADHQGVKRIYVQALRRDGMGLAVMNRLARAAGFDIKTARDLLEGQHDRKGNTE